MGKLPFSEEALDSIKKAKIRVLSKDSRIKKSKSVSGTKNPSFRTKMMNKDGINKRVPINEVQKFLEDGWTLGMICENKKERSQRINSSIKDKATAKDKIYVHTEEEPYLVRYSSKEDLDFYLNTIHWSLGRGDHYKEIRKENLTKIYMFNVELKICKRSPIELKDLYLTKGWKEGMRKSYFSNI